MAGTKPDSKIPGARPSAADERRAQVGAMLRNADRLIKDGKFADARAEIAKVRAIEPNHPYALAFEERISVLEHADKPKVGEREVSAPATPKPATLPDVKSAPSTAAPPVDVLRSEIEQKLEIQYREKFAEEIRKAEQRVAEAIRTEEEKHAVERSDLLEQLQKERTKYRQQLEDSFQHKLDEELRLAQERFSEQLKTERSAAEKLVREELEKRHSAQIEELKSTSQREASELQERERRSIEDLRAKLEHDFDSRLANELQNMRKSSASEQEQVRKSLEESLRDQSRLQFEKQLSEERTRIEREFSVRQSDLDKELADRKIRLEEELRRQTESRLAELKEQETRSFERMKEELQRSLEAEFRNNLQMALSEERSKIELEYQRSLESERVAFAGERKKLLEAEQAKLERERQTLREQMDADLLRHTESASREAAKNYEYRMSLLGIEMPKTRDERMMVYKSRLREAWSGGPLTMEKAQRLMELQDILNLSFEEHAEAETEVRLQLYAETVEQLILGGKIKANDTRSVEEIKQRFDITSDEASNVEPLILSAFQRATTKAMVMVVDDDEELLRLIKERLEESGYHVIAYSTLAEAMENVESTSVDLILSDIKFKGEKGDGFTFFKFVQQKPHLRKIPFILMSALDEGLFIRTGVQLGVDDYLTKPLDLDLLAAVIEGKLKKYKSMRLN